MTTTTSTTTISYRSYLPKLDCDGHDHDDSDATEGLATLGGYSIRGVTDATTMAAMPATMGDVHNDYDKYVKLHCVNADDVDADDVDAATSTPTTLAPTTSTLTSSTPTRKATQAVSPTLRFAPVAH